ncbi:MAG: LPXTG cell wall anchor domain-containing protein [Oscillospiraceae bacterium]|nr:LPXTG cell wall anchor domain-containing protein [Oscillospiraceae bacterium]
MEDEAPTGYNKLKDPIYFEIEAEHTNDPANLELKTLTATHQTYTESGHVFADYGTGAIDFTEAVSDGSVRTSVKNKAGSELPSTGGIGTTPFYVGGGVLVAAAGVYIIVKKRMKNNDEEK